MKILKKNIHTKHNLRIGKSLAEQMRFQTEFTQLELQESTNLAKGA